MGRPTDTYGERPRGTLQRLLVKGVLLGITTGVIGALSLYLNFINLFLFFLRLFGGSRN